MIDLHLHTTCSDGKDTIEELISNVKNAGVEYFSITDHDTARAGREILSNEALQNKIKENGLKYVTGCEFSCIFGSQEMHILAYDFDPFAPEVAEIEAKFAKLLKEKDDFRLREIETRYKLSEKSHQYLDSKENVRKLDFANCLVNDGYFANVDDACQQYLNKMHYDGPDRLDAVYVVETMTKIGAKMVWAHSLHGVTDKPISHEEVEHYARELKQYGLVGLECYYSLYNEEEIEKLVEIAERLDLVVTCGSDYHGKNKPVKLAMFSSDGSTPDFEKVGVQQIFKNNTVL